MVHLGCISNEKRELRPLQMMSFTTRKGKSVTRRKALRGKAQEGVANLQHLLLIA
jgi:hypothetical protein